MAADVFDPRLGPSRMAFPEPTGGIGAVIGSVVALLIGIAFVGMAVTDTHTGGAASDMAAGVCLLVTWNLLAVFVLYVSASGLVQEPVRHVCDHGIAVVTKQGRVRGVVLFRDVEHLDIVEVVARSGAIGLRLSGGALSLDVPTRDVAHRVYAMWQAEREAKR